MLSFSNETLGAVELHLWKYHPVSSSCRGGSRRNCPMSRQARGTSPLLHYHHNFICAGGSKVSWEQSNCPPPPLSLPPSFPLSLSFCHRLPTQTPSDGHDDDEPLPGVRQIQIQSGPLSARTSRSILSSPRALFLHRFSLFPPCKEEAWRDGESSWSSVRWVWCSWITLLCSSRRRSEIFYWDITSSLQFMDKPPPVASNERRKNRYYFF